MNTCGTLARSLFTSSASSLRCASITACKTLRFSSSAVSYTHLILVLVFIMWLGWGIRGAALATIISQATAMIYQLKLFTKDVYKRQASTISQQLAKNMFRVRSQYSTGLLGKIPGLKILIVKSKEWIIATKLETVYDKKEILTMYANTVDFGSNAYGIKTAAKTYFDTTPKDLKTEEAAVLVGMLKATTLYNPKTNPKNSLARRNTVSVSYTHLDVYKRQVYGSAGFNRKRGS